MATPRGGLSSVLGLPDVREKTKQDLVNLYSDYILGGKPRSVVKGVPVGKTSGEPGWGEPTETDDEEISSDKGQVVEIDEDAEEPAAPSAEEAAIDEDAEAEAVDAAGALPAASSKNPYDEKILAELESAKNELMKQKRLSIADILGAGNIRKSAQLIRETEKLNEQRQMKAKELALDILMRKSAGEEKRQAAEELANYRREMLDVRRLAAQREPQDPSQVRADRIAAKAMFPKLTEDQAYAKYLREVKYRPPAGREPRPEDYRIRMGRLMGREAQGLPLTPEEKAEIDQYKRRGSGLEALLEILGRQNP